MLVLHNADLLLDLDFPTRHNRTKLRLLSASNNNRRHTRLIGAQIRLVEPFFANIPSIGRRARGPAGTIAGVRRKSGRLATPGGERRDVLGDEGSEGWKAGADDAATWFRHGPDGRIDVLVGEVLRQLQVLDAQDRDGSRAVEDELAHLCLLGWRGLQNEGVEFSSQEPKAENADQNNLLPLC